VAVVVVVTEIEYLLGERDPGCGVRIQDVGRRVAGMAGIARTRVGSAIGERAERVQQLVGADAFTRDVRTAGEPHERERRPAIELARPGAADVRLDRRPVVVDVVVLVGVREA